MKCCKRGIRLQEKIYQKPIVDIYMQHYIIMMYEVPCHRILKTVNFDILLHILLLLPLIFPLLSGAYVSYNVST